MAAKHIYLFRFTHGESNEDLIEGFIGDGKQITKIEELASMQNALREQGYENPKIKDYKLLRKEKSKSLYSRFINYIRKEKNDKA